MKEPGVAPVECSTLSIELLSEYSLKKDLGISDYPTGSKGIGGIKAKSCRQSGSCFVSSVFLVLLY